MPMGGKVFEKMLLLSRFCHEQYEYIANQHEGSIGLIKSRPYMADSRLPSQNRLWAWLAYGQVSFILKRSVIIVIFITILHVFPNLL